jgi:hypothetical protein
MAHLYHTDFCGDCIYRQIAQELRVENVITDHNNHETIRQRIIELLRELERQIDQNERMGKPT